MSRTRCSCGKYIRESQAQCTKCFDRDFLKPINKKRKSPRRKISLGHMLAAGAMANLFMRGFEQK